jgi:hypothetical protein
MADIYLSHASQDRRIAAELSAALAAAGYSTFRDAAELSPVDDWQERLLQQVKTARLVLVLWSRHAANSRWLQLELRLALEAWEADRLLLIRLDASELPVGLRDINHLDLPDAARAAGVARIVDAVRDRLAKAVPAVHDLGPPPAPRPATARARRRVAPAVLALLLMSVLGLLAYSYAWWYPAPYVGGHSVPAPSAGPSPPAPGGEAGPSPSETVAPEPSATTYQLVLVIGAVVVVAGLVAAVVVQLRRRRSPRSAPTAALTPGATRADAPREAALFVSYSRDDSAEVMGLVVALEQSGLSTWLDTRHVGGERFAGPIVQAIRGARACAFMCSANAYGSDHVVRELYLADKYRKPMIPVELAPGPLAADFEYFFSGLDFVPARPAERCVQAILQRLDRARDSLGAEAASGSAPAEARSGREQAA